MPGYNRKKLKQITMALNGFNSYNKTCFYENNTDTYIGEFPRVITV